MSGRLAVILLLACALLAAAAGVVTYIWLGGPAEDTGSQRIDFRLTDLDGVARHANEWDGRVVLLNFWAPWCGPCRAEVPLLVELQKRYGDHGLQILGPALDEEEAVREFAAEYGINYPLFAQLNAVMDLQEAYGDTRLPYTVLLDRQGRIAYRHAGELEAEEIEAQIRKLMP